MKERKNNGKQQELMLSATKEARTHENAADVAEDEEEGWGDYRQPKRRLKEGNLRREKTKLTNRTPRDALSAETTTKTAAWLPDDVDQEEHNQETTKQQRKSAP